MSTYDIKVFSIAGEVYHEVTGLSGSTRVGEILSEVKSGPAVQRQLLYQGQVLPKHGLLADVLPPGQADLQLMVQKGQLKRVRTEGSAVTVQLVMAGVRGVGKTSLVSRYCKDEFLEEPGPVMLTVIQTDFTTQRVMTHDGTCLRLIFWDEHALPPHHAMSPHRLRNKHGAILIFDITNRRSFTELQTMWSTVTERPLNLLSKVLMGNKSDMEQQRQVTREEAQSFADAQNLPYFEVSLKEGSQGVEDVVTHLVFDALDKLPAQEAPLLSQGAPEQRVQTEAGRCHVL